ncbi:putative calcium ion binding protein [Xylariomycetidae sp. FL2044]|nr:putative calcium ion binding protein [Xylariomycetidae sp. FL2044]
MRSIILVTASLACGAIAHGNHGESQKPMVGEDADWMTKHMAEEHHISEFDASSFFTLHDYDADGKWEPEEMLRTYGLFDESNAGVPASRRDAIQAELLRLLDADGDRSVSRAEFAAFVGSGNTLPDLQTGPGHHGDDEYEYEIHHWEKYHDDDTTLEELTHPEDIEHFKKHEQMEVEEERLEKMDRMAIVEDNIPSKFRRGG